MLSSYQSTDRSSASTSISSLQPSSGTTKLDKDDNSSSYCYSDNLLQTLTYLPVVQQKWIFAISLFVFVVCVPFLTLSNSATFIESNLWMVPKSKERHREPIDEWNVFDVTATPRCDYIVKAFVSRQQQDGRPQPQPNEDVAEAYKKQSVNANVFYRATASIFWQDFVSYGWDNHIYRLLLAQGNVVNNNTSTEGFPLFADEDDKTTWTWVTGDQHLSNFGAWRNRNDNIVFGVNDFDEAAIYDFHMDVIRLAVSLYNHGQVNGLTTKQNQRAVHAFTSTYIQTIIGYLGNEKATTFELTADTAKGKLHQFLLDVATDKSHSGQLERFTNTKNVGKFIRNNRTRLESVTSRMELALREALTSQQYGATLLKTGWRVPRWSDEHFAVLDVARRVGSGIGSFGVDRFYVLLNGTGHNNHIILDIKYEPVGSVVKVLSDDDRAWYQILFLNEAARAVEAQRRLTSYVDPYTGWILLNGKAFLVRQRSPWKSSPDLDQLTNPNDFRVFAEMVGIATATSHTRGTTAKSPGEFKQVIAGLLGDKKTRKIWSDAVRRIAENYSQQVKMDYVCFRDFVRTNYP